jgi:hypothetical protein
MSAVGISQHLVADSLALGTVFSSTDSVATLQILDQVGGRVSREFDG